MDELESDICNGCEVGETDDPLVLSYPKYISLFGAGNLSLKSPFKRWTQEPSQNYQNV